MTAKPKTTKKNLEKIQPTADLPAVGKLDEINLTDIVVSPLKSQANRRARFSQPALVELTGNVKINGLINPITVRPVGKKFEIVAGERRFLACGRAGLQTIPAIVKDLTDAQSAEIQLIENLQREDLHPLDESYSYYDMQTVLKYDETEIAKRVGKSFDYVRDRLKLRVLPDEVKAAFERDEITLSHALEIAKYPPDAHTEIFKFCFDKNYQGEINGLRPLRKMRKEIQEKYLLLLKHAPFPITSTELRFDGLACKKCPERTGANKSLFEGDFEVKGDCCLNSSCWQKKSEAYFNLNRRQAVINDLKVPEADADKFLHRVPLIQEGYLPDDKLPKNETILRLYHLYRFDTGEELCPKAQIGIMYNGDDFAKTRWFCNSSDCPKHGRRFSSSGTDSKKSPEEELEEKRQERLIRKEELFDVRVGAAVRQRVLKLAAEKFTGFANTERDLLLRCVARFWRLQQHWESYETRVIAQIAADYFGIKETRYATNEVRNAIDNKLESLSDENLRKIMFLLLNGFISPMFNFDDGTGTNAYRSQKDIRDLASFYEIDYQILDATERINQASMKHKEPFRKYLQELESGDRNASLPRMYSTKWDAKKRKLEDKK